MAARAICQAASCAQGRGLPRQELTARQEPDLPPNLAQAARLIQNLGHFPALNGHDAELLSRYDETLDRIVADIDAAACHVHLFFCIFAYDASGKRIIEALARAVGRGVVCRVLVDALGSRAWASQLTAALTAAVVTCRAWRDGRRRDFGFCRTAEEVAP